MIGVNIPNGNLCFIIFTLEFLLNYFKVAFMKRKATVAPWESPSSFQRY